MSVNYLKLYILPRVLYNREIFLILLILVWEGGGGGVVGAVVPIISSRISWLKNFDACMVASLTLIFNTWAQVRILYLGVFDDLLIFKLQWKELLPLRAELEPLVWRRRSCVRVVNVLWWYISRMAVPNHISPILECQSISAWEINET